MHSPAQLLNPIEVSNSIQSCISQSTAIVCMLEALHTCNGSDSSFTDKGCVKTSRLANNNSLVYRDTTATSIKILEDKEMEKEGVRGYLK